MLEAVLLILAAYLWGSIPSAYLVGKYVKGIDIRQYGSGNVGASNVMEHVGGLIGLAQGAFDTVGKGTLAVVAAQVFGHGLSVQAAAGLAAVAGHNWSPYIRFGGGRGVSVAIGVMLGMLMWWELIVLAIAVGFIGRTLMRETAFWVFLSFLGLPLMARLTGEPQELVYMSAGMAGLLALKRLTANWEKPVGGYPLPKVLFYRLLWDRDVPRQAKWTSRTPQHDEKV